VERGYERLAADTSWGGTLATFYHPFPARSGPRTLLPHTWAMVARPNCVSRVSLPFLAPARILGGTATAGRPLMRDAWHIAIVSACGRRTFLPLLAGDESGCHTLTPSPAASSVCSRDMYVGTLSRAQLVYPGSVCRAHMEAVRCWRRSTRDWQLRRAGVTPSLRFTMFFLPAPDRERSCRTRGRWTLVLTAFLALLLFFATTRLEGIIATPGRALMRDCATTGGLVCFLAPRERRRARRRWADRDGRPPRAWELVRRGPLGRRSPA